MNKLKMTVNDIRIKKADEGDIPGIMSLINPRWAPYKPEGYFYWILFGSAVPAVAMCAYHGKDIIGMFMLHKRTLSNGASCGIASHLVIDDKWRGKGYFSMLGHKASEYFGDMDMLCSMPNVPGKAALERNFGYKTPGRISTLVLKTAGEFDLYGSECEPVSNNTIFGKSAGSEKGTVMFEHGHEYRLWRYAMHELYDFSIVNAASGEYAVIKLFIDPASGIKYGDIADLECPLEDEERLERLIAAACGHLRDKGADNITVWASPGGQLDIVARKLGFTDDGQSHFFCLKILNSRYKGLYDIGRWHLVQSDVIR
ncbi:MAG: GNAT family N-acetyltransferase [Elusimicrobia bacterium]|nr:GNAT family N-acetyltransferase [Elusimicrobiota bacterium]